MVSYRLFAALVTASLLAACSLDPEQILTDIDDAIGVSALGSSYSANAAAGLVVGDEPFAVRAGASMLAEGGSGADAAAAMYFALAVTYPSAAGLGGGGICIAHDTRSGLTRSFEFLARDPQGGGSLAVPGNVRGFETLQRALGRVSWRRIVAPAVSLAAAGFPLSRTLVSRLTAVRDQISLDADISAEFLDNTGAVKSAGEIVYNRALAETLASIRIYGSNGFYGGEVAAAIEAFAAAQGGTVRMDDLRGYNIALGLPLTVRVGNETVALPSVQVRAGTFANALFDNLSKALASNPDVNAATITALQQALTETGITSFPADLSATGFAVADANGQAVSCAVTMNGTFGTGRSVPGTGITLARAPAASPSAMASTFLTPLVATGADGRVAMAGAAAGGPNASALIARALYQLANGEPMTRRSDLQTAGATPDEQVNAIVCQSGICSALPDPGGSSASVSTNAAN